MLGDHLLADPNLARLHELLVDLELLLAELNPLGPLGNPGGMGGGMQVKGPMPGRMVVTSSYRPPALTVTTVRSDSDSP